MRSATASYRWGTTAALVTLVLLFVGIGALGINGAGGEADRMYLAVPAVLLVGSVVSRLRPRGLALALVAVALTHALLAVLALALGYQHEAGASAVEILAINAMYAVLFAGSGWLFLQAGERTSSVG